MFNVIIIGGEDTLDYNFFQERCIYYLRKKAESGEGITIFTTGDDFVETFATRFHINTKTFRCDWKLNGSNAIKVRNDAIIENANAIIYFDNGKKDCECLYNRCTKLIPSRKIIIP